MYETTLDAPLLITRLSSPVTVDEIREWKASLEREVAKIPDGGTFKLLADLRGYDFSLNAPAHQEMRVVLPLLLARHGLRTALLDLFPESTVEVTAERGVTCTAAAYVHHNVEKMATFNENLERPREEFSTDRVAAEAWIRAR
jgi:hypothetical protein